MTAKELEKKVGYEISRAQGIIGNSGQKDIQTKLF